MNERRFFPLRRKPTKFENENNVDFESPHGVALSCSILGGIGIALLICLVMFLTSCTDNSKAKSWGGTATVDLPPNTKFVNATWKGEEMWYLYRPMREGEVAESVTMQEQSSFGWVEGTVIFKESK